MEKTDDILSQMRSMKSSTLNGKMWVNTIHSFANRLEKAREFELAVAKSKVAGKEYAAGRRSVLDCYQHGNSVKMSAALEAIIDTIDKWRADGSMEHWQYSNLFDIANDALADTPGTVICTKQPNKLEKLNE
jgi:hypothetical protein